MDQGWDHCYGVSGDNRSFSGWEQNLQQQPELREIRDDHVGTSEDQPGSLVGIEAIPLDFVGRNADAECTDSLCLAHFNRPIPYDE